MKGQQASIIHVRENLNWKEKQIAVELARLLGFQSESAVFPVVSKELGEEIPADFWGLQKYRTKNNTKVPPKGYVSASEEARAVPDFDWRGKKGLETLFTVGPFLKDENWDFLPDEMDVQLVMSKDSDIHMLGAVCTVAFRLGMETTAFKGLLLVDKEGDGNSIVFEEGERCLIRYEQKEKGTRIVITGKGEELEVFVANFCENFPLQGGFDTWTDYLQEVIDSMCMKNFDGQLAYAKAYVKEGAVVYTSPEGEKGGMEFNQRLRLEFPEVSFINHKGSVKAYEKEYDIPWEIDVFYKMLDRHLYPQLKKGDKIRVYGALSEGKEERHKVTKRVKESLQGAGVEIQEIHILCAYKQGYSWMEEVVVPYLRTQGEDTVHRVEIGFKPFLPLGITDWADEDGVIPSYNNLGGDPNQWYDLPIRYLQELYPLEDMIKEQLGIARENLYFYAYKGDKDLTYEVKVYDPKGERICETAYKATCRERAYLDDYPHMGKVHPSTGYLQVVVNDREVLYETIETDVERIWNLYQSQVLKDLRAYIEDKSKGEIALEDQPFFAKLEVEVAVSEPNERLPSREDLFSTLDGLHEDMYFVGLDYFKNYGMEKVKAVLDAPGLILPIIRQRKGKPYMKATLFDQKEKSPCVINGGERIWARGTRDTVNAWLEAIEETEQGIKAVLRLEGVDEEVVVAYAELMEKGILNLGEKIFDVDVLEFVTPKRRCQAKVNRAVMKGKKLSIHDIDFCEGEVIGYDKYREIIEQLKQVPDLNVFQVATSYLGREIYGVELLPSCRGYISRTKRITKYPSQIINSRHHANEVSSTNSAFMLIKILLTEDTYKHIRENMNLVIVPLENVDGAALHYELQKDNPDWKLHVARFNAIGKEFYYEHFKPHTIHTEAMGMTRLFRAFLPDIIVDNHGVPKHEWEQQFSGYTSPSYKGFWLPRSLLYGYFWTVEGEAYKSNYAVNKKLEDVIADSMIADEEITGWNKEWAEQFEKFAHGWMPKLFPAKYYKNMINYWVPFAFDLTHRYPSIRFPWITSVAYTSEVADETAQGEYLKLCTRAHLAHDLATLKLMGQSICIYKNKWNISDEGIEVACIRQRPVIV